MVNEMKVGDGKVFLIAGGGKTYCDMAAKFCRTEKDVEDIIASPQSKALIKDLISSGHKAALEFDNFLFGIQGYARVTEIQLVRKRHASYMIKSGRNDEHGKRKMDVVIPDNITKFSTKQILNPEKITLKFSNPNGIAEVKLNDCFPLMKQQFQQSMDPLVIYNYNYKDILNLIDTWYSEGVTLSIPEEDLRYMKPQATEFKAAVMMNCAALSDFFRIRLCNRAQKEIRDLATKMYKICYEQFPYIFESMGSKCKCDGYCTERDQCKELKGKVPTKDQVMNLINNHRDELFE